MPDACRPGCVAARCGDGAIDTGEACDDGNDAAEDGCSACVVDAGWRGTFEAGAGIVCELLPSSGDGDTTGGDTSGGDTSGCGPDTGGSSNTSGGCGSAGGLLGAWLALSVQLGVGSRRRWQKGPQARGPDS